MKWAFVSIQTMTGGNLELFLESTASTAASIRIRRMPACLHACTPAHGRRFPCTESPRTGSTDYSNIPKSCIIEVLLIKSAQTQKSMLSSSPPPPVNVSEEEEDYL